MHNILKTYFKFAVLALLCSVAIPVIAAADSANSNPDPLIGWVKRPWGWRYLMYISTEWDTRKKMAKLTNEKIGPQALDREWMPLFDATHFFQSKKNGAHPGNGISVVVIEFDKDGKVTSPHTFGKPLHGRIGNPRIGHASVDQPVAVTLASGDPGVDPQFDFGWWFLGLSDASIHSAPSICSGTHMSSFYDLIDSSYLYGPALHISIEFATVGCREWAYQIKKYGRPYIDVTSYIPKPCYRKGLEHYIHETIGWAGFGDHKPIIGKHENDWYCLHDCPRGDRPGIIRDIKAWADRNGWKAPQPPTRVPVFPDPPAEFGYYP